MYAIQRVKDTIKGMAIRFTPDIQALALTSPYAYRFSETTIYGMESDSARFGFYYDHGMSELAGMSSVCHGTLARDEDEVGQGYSFTTDPLDPKNGLQKLILEKVDAQELGYSSGAIQHLFKGAWTKVEIGETTEYILDVTQWIVGEVSVTTNPADNRNVTSLQNLSELETLITVQNRLSEASLKKYSAYLAERRPPTVQKEILPLVVEEVEKKIFGVYLPRGSNNR